MLNIIHGWGISARAHVHTALLYLRNGSTDGVQIWYVGWRSLSTCFPQVMGGVGHLCTYACAHPSPYLRIRVTNCGKILRVAREPIVSRFTRVGVGVTTFASACPVSCLETAEPWHWTHTKNRLISFALARSSPNMASFWYLYNIHLLYMIIYFVYVTGRLRNPCVCKHPRVYANTRPNQGVCIHPRAFANALRCLQTPGSFRAFAYTP